MLCLFFSASLDCHAPWTWWMLLNETDQATWFGAWSAAAAFLGGLVVYAHGKSDDRKSERERKALSAQRQAIQARVPLERLLSDLRHKAEKLDEEQLHFVNEKGSGLLGFHDLKELRSALNDPGSFGLKLGTQLQSFIALVKEIEFALEKALGNERTDGGGTRYVLLWDPRGSGPHFSRAIKVGEDLRDALRRVEDGGAI